MSVDYLFKAKVIEQDKDLFKMYHNMRKRQYAMQQFYDNGVIVPFFDLYSRFPSKAEYFDKAKRENRLKEALEVEKIHNSSRNKVKRLRKRIKSILDSEGNSIFLTLTFNDETLESTTEKQRRLRVVRFLENNFSKYVANIDYGNLHEREHYHAVCLADKIDLKSWNNKNGFSLAKRIHNKDAARLAKYVNKLVNHAVKETTRRAVSIYSR